MLGGPRIIFAVAGSGMFPRVGARLDPRFKTPTVALWLQAAWTSGLILSAWLVHKNSVQVLLDCGRRMRADDRTGAARPKRLEDQKVGDDLCQGAEATSEAGSRVYGVDATSHALRRLEYPIGPLEKILDPSGSLKNLAVRADLKGAQLDKTVSVSYTHLTLPTSDLV